MEGLQLNTTRERIAFLLDEVPGTRDNSLYLLLSYWQLFDGIEIPEEVVMSIIERGIAPETVARSKRRAMEMARTKEILEIERLRTQK